MIQKILFILTTPMTQLNSTIQMKNAPVKILKMVKLWETPFK